MGYIREFCENDVAEVAQVHSKVYFGNNNVSEGLCSYYREIFLNNPWFDDRYGSLVSCSDEGRITGFIGRIVRPMRFEDKLINAAVCHRLMVDPEHAGPFAGSLLVRKFLSGEQDITIGDGSSDDAIKIWKAAGGSMSLIYSMNWFTLLRPLGFAISLTGKKSGLSATITSPLISLLKPFDAVSNLLRNKNYSFKPADTFDIELTANGLLKSINEFTLDYKLRPEYEISHIQWLYDILKANKHRGDLKGYIVKGDKGEIIGSFMYYLKDTGFCEVIFITAHKKCRSKVLHHLLYRATADGAVGIYGRMEPDFLESFWENKFLIKRGSWALVHARDENILNIIHKGNAFISALEGECWLYSPSVKL